MSPEAFIQQSLTSLETQTAAHSATWHLDTAPEWSADQEAGTLVFTLADGTMASTAFQIVGTYDTKAGTFLWAWDHPSVARPLRRHAQLAREWGAQHSLSQYTTRLVQCSEDQAWQFTAVAARLGNANGAYRGPSGSTYVFMTFGTVKLEKP